jgi:hypothetical protein
MTKSTKLSCKNGDFASSVVVLKDGSVLEVRRGKETRFIGMERQRWPTVDAWKATLPAAATVKTDGAEAVVAASGAGKRAPVDKWATTNPALANFITKARAYSDKHGPTLRRSNCYPAGTYRSRIEKDIATAKIQVAHRKALTYAVNSLKFYESQLAECEKTLSKMIEKGTADDMTYDSTLTPRFLTLTATKEILPVFYNIEDNVIFYKDCTKGYYTPITDPEAPFWYEVERGHMRKL